MLTGAGSWAVPGNCSQKRRVLRVGSPLCTEVLAFCSVCQRQIPNKGISSPLLCRWFSAIRRWRGRSRSALPLHRLSMVPQHLTISSVHQEVRSINRPGLLIADGDSSISEGLNLRGSISQSVRSKICTYSLSSSWTDLPLSCLGFFGFFFAAF